MVAAIVTNIQILRFMSESALTADGHHSQRSTTLWHILDTAPLLLLGLDIPSPLKVVLNLTDLVGMTAAL